MKSWTAVCLVSLCCAVFGGIVTLFEVATAMLGEQPGNAWAFPLFIIGMAAAMYAARKSTGR